MTTIEQPPSDGAADPSAIFGATGPGAPTPTERAPAPEILVELAPTGSVSPRRRLAGLEGLRGLAALFVVLHHSYLLSFPGYPHNTGPHWLAFLLYGHFAVALFIVLSGFSLGVSPARAGWKLDSSRRFFYRRAWRILPSYWPALLYSLLIAWFITAQPGEGTPGLKSVLVNGLLIQDVTGAPSPNGAFWSIPVEVQIYLFFPLMIWATRRWGGWAMVSTVAVPVVLIQLLSPHSSAVNFFTRFNPQFALLFAAGVAAAAVVRSAHRWLAALPWLTLVTFAAVVVAIAAMGPVRALDHLSWLDIALGPALVLCVAGVAAGRPRWALAVLDWRPIRGLGSISFSLYLTHAPVVVVWYDKVAGPHFGHGLGAFWLFLITVVPLAIIVAAAFAAVFELPFVRAKNWAGLRARYRSGGGSHRVPSDAAASKSV